MLRKFCFAVFLGVAKAPRLILSLVKPPAFCTVHTGNVGFSSESLLSTPKRMVLYVSYISNFRSLYFLVLERPQWGGRGAESGLGNKSSGQACTTFIYILMDFLIPFL